MVPAVAALLGRLPEKADWVEIGEFRLTVLEMKDRHVEQARIEVTLSSRSEDESSTEADAAAADQALDVPSSIPSGKAASNSPL